MASSRIRLCCQRCAVESSWRCLGYQRKKGGVRLRAGVRVSGGSSSREESTLGGGGSFSGLTARTGRGGAVLSRILGFMERLIFSYLERSGGEIARLRVKADSVVLCCSGSVALWSLRVGEIPVLAHRNQECSGFLWLWRRGLNLDVTVVEVSVLSRVVVYGYKGFPSCPTTPSSFVSRLLVQFTPCVGDGLLSGFNLAIHCGITLRGL
ncbi:hypothetical protein YC2023_052480 [Brassica napus]